MMLRCKAAVPASEYDDVDYHGIDDAESVDAKDRSTLAYVSVLIEEKVASSLEVLSRKYQNGHTMFVDIRVLPSGHVLNTDKGSYFLCSFIGSQSSSVLEWAVYDFDDDEHRTCVRVGRGASMLTGYSVFKAAIRISGIDANDFDAVADLSAFEVSGATITLCLNMVHHYSCHGTTLVDNPALPQVARDVVGLSAMKEVME